MRLGVGWRDPYRIVSIICWSNFAVKGVPVTMSCRRHSEKWRSKDLYRIMPPRPGCSVPSTYHWHSSNVALDGRFIGFGQQFPAGVKLEAGVVGLLALASLEAGDRLTLEGRDILVFGNDAFECLGVLVPEQEIRSQLEILSCMEGNEMDVVKSSDDV